MAGRLTRSAYQKLVDENIEWLLKQPRTLERDHIHEILKLVVVYEYGPDEENDRCIATRVEYATRTTAASFDDEGREALKRGIDLAMSAMRRRLGIASKRFDADD
jgi:hypothetical protein